MVSICKTATSDVCFTEKLNFQMRRAIEWVPSDARAHPQQCLHTHKRDSPCSGRRVRKADNDICKSTCKSLAQLQRARTMCLLTGMQIRVAGRTHSRNATQRLTESSSRKGKSTKQIRTCRCLRLAWQRVWWPVKGWCPQHEQTGGARGPLAPHYARQVVRSCQASTPLAHGVRPPPGHNSVVTVVQPKGKRAIQDNSHSHVGAEQSSLSPGKVTLEPACSLQRMGLPHGEHPVYCICCPELHTAASTKREKRAAIIAHDSLRVSARLTSGGSGGPSRFGTASTYCIVQLYRRSCFWAIKPSGRESVAWNVVATS